MYIYIDITKGENNNIYCRAVTKCFSKKLFHFREILNINVKLCFLTSREYLFIKFWRKRKPKLRQKSFFGFSQYFLNFLQKFVGFFLILSLHSFVLSHPLPPNHQGLERLVRQVRNFQSRTERSDMMRRLRSVHILYTTIQYT